ncbi:L-fucose kinase-like [Montipora capricornis]|uniref:L-fucose kinase-like n=1 Tax=Montipora capricornis TaxID=246305 RepID=UPI0035F1D72C
MRKKTGDRKSAWNAIVFTCLSKTSARTIQKELDIHQSKGFIGKDVLILTLEDPKGGVGSGGATLNALLVVTEHLSAKAGFRVVTESVLENARILIMHLGQNFPFSSCGRFFNQLPAKHTEESKENLCDAVVLNFDLVFHIISDTLSVNAPPGVWICSSDMIPSISPDQKINWEQLSGGFTVFLSQGDVKYAKDHGVAKLGENGDIKDIIFRESEDKIRSFALDNGMVPVVSGWVYMGSKVAFKVLSLHVYHPLDACSYYGLDNGAEPIQLSMIFDILLCMAEDVTESAFVEGDRSGTYGRGIQLETSRTTEQEAMLMRSARAQLWNKLRGLQLKGVFLENGTFDYMKVSAECYRRQITQSVESLHLSGMPSSSSNLTHVAFLKNGTLHDCDNHVSKSCVVVNSVLESGIKVGENSVITNCDLKGDVTIGPGSVFIGVSSDNMKSVPVGFTFPDDLCLMQFNVNLPKLSDKPQQVLVVMGVHDDLQVPFSSADSSYCNKPWRTFFNETGINPEEIWFGVPEDEQCLWNARLFSVVHFFDFANEKTCKDDLLWLAMVTYGSAGSSNGDSDVNRNFISDPERSQHQGLNSCLKRWRSSLRMSLKEIMSLLDLSAEFKLTKSLWFQIGKAQVEDTLRNCTSDCLLPFFRSCTQEGFAKDLLETLDQVASSTSSPGVAARTLACIADVLGAMAGESTGLRSGPARNESWMEAVKFLEKGDIQAGVKRLAEERKLWFDRPDLLIRAARHYEGAEQILRRQAVFTAEKFFEIEESEPLPMGHWVIAEAPARADLSGCWTDTPPITYEHGGAVLTVAINLNGKKVMGAKVRKIPTLEILLVIHSGEHSLRVACTELSHLENYTQPHAPGALLKACFCLLDIVTLPSSESLTEQLRKKYNAGFELHTWSVAPQGSAWEPVVFWRELSLRHCFGQQGEKLLWTLLSMQFYMQQLRNGLLGHGRAVEVVWFPLLASTCFSVFFPCQFFEIEESEPLPMGHWVIAEAPARADLSGCWTDTPPITYEHGGAVLTVAINLNGKKVMGAKVRKIPTLEILLVIHSGEHSLRVACTELSHLENYTQPHAPGALLKACFCLLDIVTLPSSESLTEQLRKKYNAGFELHTWSVAPQGSGLGTSSILAGVILAALLRATGRKATLDSLVHAVLLIEQMLTTGGGWQDNAGGLVPGFKMTRSKASLPLKVEVESLQLSQETVDKFSERLICLYSGKPRLAKNLLQDVVRNWYARFPQITENADNLISNAEEAVLALKEGNIEKFGACMSCYRKQKSIMAPGTEPDSIHEVMEALDPLVLGQTLTGAGGGGFLVLITKEPNMADKVKAVIEEKKASERFAFYDVSVDWDGLTVRVETSSQ